MAMHIFDGLLMFAIVVAAVVTIYCRLRRGSAAGRKLPRSLTILLAVVFSLSAAALFIAKRLFGVLPAWPFHLSLAAAMSVLAIATYLDYRHKPTI